MCWFRVGLVMESQCVVQIGGSGTHMRSMNGPDGLEHEMARTGALIKESVVQPTARNVAGVVASLLRGGQIDEGARLPNVRDLAADLGVSPATISQAWTLLRRRGLLHGRGKSGVTVSTILEAAPETHAGAAGRTLDLRFLLPDQELLPTRLEPALLSALEIPTLNQYDRVPILPELRDVISPSWPFTAEGYVATSGGIDAVDLALRTLTVPGDRVAIENPTSTPVLRALANLNLLPVPVAEDDAGPTVEGLKAALKTQPAVFLLQPRARVPTGTVMEKKRLEELAGALKGTAVNVLELDFGNLLSTVSPRSIGCFAPKRTLLVRSFSKSHGPDLRVAVIGGPAEHVRAMNSRVRGSRQWTSKILQGALAWMLEDPATINEVVQASRIYALRRQQLLEALEPRIDGMTNGDGLCLWLPVLHEGAALDCLSGRGILAFEGSKAWVEEKGPHLRLSTTFEISDLEDVADRLVEASNCKRQ